MENTQRSAATKSGEGNDDGGVRLVRETRTSKTSPPKSHAPRLIPRAII